MQFGYSFKNQLDQFHSICTHTRNWAPTNFRPFEILTSARFHKSYWDAGLIIIQCLQPEPFKLLYKLIVRSLTMSGRNSKSVTEYTWLSSGSEAMDFSSFSSIWAIPTRKMHDQIENYTFKQRLGTKIISVSSKWISQASLLLAKNRKLTLKLVSARLETPEIFLSTATFKCWD